MQAFTCMNDFGNLGSGNEEKTVILPVAIDFGKHVLVFMWTLESQEASMIYVQFR